MKFDGVGFFCLPPELKELVVLHQETTDANEDPLRDDEVLIIQVQEEPGTNRYL